MVDDVDKRPTRRLATGAPTTCPLYRSRPLFVGHRSGAPGGRILARASGIVLHDQQFSRDIRQPNRRSVRRNRAYWTTDRRRTRSFGRLYRGAQSGASRRFDDPAGPSADACHRHHDRHLRRYRPRQWRARRQNWSQLAHRHVGDGQYHLRACALVYGGNDSIPGRPTRISEDFEWLVSSTCRCRFGMPHCS